MTSEFTLGRKRINEFGKVLQAKLDVSVVVKTRSALLFNSGIDVTTRQILLENMISTVLTSYAIAILLVAVTVVLARFEARQYADRSRREAARVSNPARKTSVAIVQTIETVLRAPKRPSQLNLKRFVSGR